MIVSLPLNPGLLVSQVKGLKPVLLYKKEYHFNTWNGQETISGTDMVSGQSLAIPTKFLRPINHKNN